ncbi:cytospin-A isoform X7 [Prorops nasuta]|uniref:cytospin-A isoform X7 n=1 Tax=Prorops nasuta TaxID=863751 RepID=UPI0034CD73D5
MLKQFFDALGGNSSRSGMSVGTGGRAPFRRVTAASAIPTSRINNNINNNATKNQSKAESRPTAGTGRKRDSVSSLFSSKRAAPSRRFEGSSKSRLKSDAPLKGQATSQPQQQSQQQPTAQSQQQVGLRQAPSVSSLEVKSESAATGHWSSLTGKDNGRSNNAKQHQSKGPSKGSRMQELEREIEVLRKERACLEANLRDATCDAQALHQLRTELASLKEQHSLELERLAGEKEILRSRLHDVSHPPLSESEKQQLLLDASRLHNSAPASIAILQDDSVSPSTIPQENANCTTPEWDKHSSSSMSEVSVACLQDRILQMEETHYSTNEELQATIQELSDLQAQLTELQADNERLTEEKGVLLESLCRQTEKLEDSRTKVDTLQGLLLREEQPQESPKGYNTEREQKLVDLLKSAQEERESLLQKQEELSSELKNLRSTADASLIETERLRKCVNLMESTVETVNIERKQIDIELAEARQESANRNIEINRLATLLENARAKIEELEQSRQVENKSEADELLDAARREKDTLETQAAALQEQLARSHCDHDRLRDQYSQLQEEYKVSRNNAKSIIDDLEYRLNQLKDERLSVTTELQLVRDSLAELQAQCQRHLEDKRELKAALSEAQRREREAQAHLCELEHALAEERKLRQEESAEWEQFQTDLLMTVRVANDFKTEAQSELERVVMENKAQRDKLRALEAQLDKLNKANIKKSHHVNADTINGINRRSENAIFKRGRTIIKTQRKTKKNFLRNSFFRSFRERKSVPNENRRVSILSKKDLISFKGNNMMSTEVKNEFKVEIVEAHLKKQELSNKFELQKNVSFDGKDTAGPTNNNNSKASQKTAQQPLPKPVTTPTETQQSVLTSVQQEMAARRKANISRQDSRLSVKCLIESIENATKQAKAGPGSRSSSTSSLNSIGSNDIMTLKAPLRDQQQINNLICTANSTNNNKTQSAITKKPLSETKSSVPVVLTTGELLDSAALNAKAIDFVRRNSVTDLSERKDPLCGLIKNGGSKRNALLKWCQNKTIGYRNIDITNFSSSWNDGLALCAILHSYLPDKIPYDTLTPVEKRRNFSIAFSAAESVGIPTTLNIGEMCQLERPDWQQVMTYVTSIYKHFET